MKAMEKARIDDLLWVRSRTPMLVTSSWPLRHYVLINVALLAFIDQGHRTAVTCFHTQKIRRRCQTHSSN